MLTINLHDLRGTSVRLDYDKAEHGGRKTYVGTVVPSPRSNPNHLCIEVEPGQYRSFDPLRILDLAVL